MDDEDAGKTLGFSTWHAPKGKDIFRYAKLSVPEPKEGVAARPTLSTKMRSADVNYLTYDTETQTLYGAINVTTFIGHKRIGGAPIDYKNKRARTGEVYKLGAGWVAPGAKAPSQGALLRTFPAAPPWASFE